MIAAFRPRVAPRRALVVLCTMVAAGCEKVPLLAPSGSSITLTANASTLPINGTVDIVAQVLEAAGTPPHDGTHVTFTTTLGTLQPSETTTDINGRAVAKFLAGTASGVATITASSGGAVVGSSGALKIAIGAAAVTGIGVSASPTTVASGRSSAITAIVTPALGSVPVTFTTDNGTVSPSVVNTDDTGTARATLTTTKTAKVTATAGIASTSGSTTTAAPSASVTVTVEPGPTASISASANPTAGLPVTFTISAQPGSGSTASIQDATISFGDGGSVNLGGSSGTNIQAQHVYSTSGTYTATVNVTDSNGARASASTVIFVSGITANFTFLPASPSPMTAVSFDASTSNATSPITSYTWNFGDPTSGSNTGSGVTISHAFETTGTHTVTLTISDNAGRTATTQRQVTVS